MGFLSYQSDKEGGSLGLLPITSLLQPRMSFTLRTNRLVMIFFTTFLTLLVLLWRHEVWFPIVLQNLDRRFWIHQNPFFIKHDVKLQKKISEEFQGFYERKNLKILKFCQKCFWNKILLDLSDRAHFFLQMVNIHKLILRFDGISAKFFIYTKGQMRGGPNRQHYS